MVRLTRSRAATTVLLRLSEQANTIRAATPAPRGLPALRAVLQCPLLSLRQHQRLQPHITQAASKPGTGNPSPPGRGLETKRNSRGEKGSSRPGR